MGALAEFFPDLEGVLIRVVNGLELMHDVGLVIFRHLVDSAVVCRSIDDFLLLVSLDHLCSDSIQ